MKKTKIICTIGPASEQKETLASLIEAGMNVMRMNFSHGDYEEQSFRIKNVRELNQENGWNVGICLDTKGPEIRTGYLEGGVPIQLRTGNIIRITMDYSFVGNENKIAMSYPGLYDDLSIGTQILCEDGNISFTIIDKDEENRELICKINNDRKLGQKRNVDVPGEVLNIDFISEKDYNDIVFACEQNVDFIAASFTRRADDVLAIKKILADHNNNHTKIIAKIENQEGINNLDEIIDIADGIMVARGDLGVNVDLWDLPQYQKDMVSRCRSKGKIAVVATQMLDSMTYNPRPTRAEVSDVHNAVLDGTGVTMLSGETANGYYPVEAVKYMARIEEVAEDYINYRRMLNLAAESMDLTDKETRLALRVAKASHDPLVEAIVAEGSVSLAYKISAFRPFVNTFYAVKSKDEARLLSIAWGIDPGVGSFSDALAATKRIMNLHSGSKVLKVKNGKLEQIIID